jgi:uncharacterized membrane protein YdjX (TVP38/TMEM64 family)
MNEERKQIVKKLLAVLLVIVYVAVLLLITIYFAVNFREISSAESFRDYVLSFGARGVLVGLGLQLLQIFVAFIPGEIIEVGLGYAFGAIMGTAICYIGVAIASALMFLLIKKYGMKAIDLFDAKDKLDNLKFVRKYVNDHDKLRTITFILFFIPGTPKDLFTYFFALTPLTLGEFLAISLIARIPSVVSSTVGGMLIHNENYIAATVLFVVTAVLSAIGWLGYEKYVKKKNADKEDAKENGETETSDKSEQ